MVGFSETISVPPQGMLGWLDLIAVLLVVVSSLSWAYDALVMRNPLNDIMGVSKLGASEGSKVAARGLYALIGLAAAYLIGRIGYSVYKQYKAGSRP